MKNRSFQRTSTGTATFLTGNGNIQQVVSSPRVSFYRDLYDVLPSEPPYPARDVSLPRAHTYRTRTVRPALGNYTLRTGSFPNPSKVIYSGEPVYPGTYTHSDLLSQNEDTTDAYAVATAKLLSQIRDSNLMLGASLAEGKQSASMVAQAVKSVFTWKKEAVSLLKDIARPLRNGSKRAANTWTQAVYGWVPLINDVYECASFHRTFLLERQIRARHGVNRPISIHDGGANTYWRRSVEGTISSRVELSRRIRVTNPQLFDLQRLGLLNPVSTVWELLPYSFVVDMVFNLGSYLEGLETACGLGYTAVNGGYDTYTVRVWSVTHITQGSDAFEQGYDSYNGDGSYSGTYKARVLNSSIPYPRVPGFKVDLRGGQIISIAALVRQRF